MELISEMTNPSVFANGSQSAPPWRKVKTFNSVVNNNTAISCNNSFENNSDQSLSTKFNMSTEGPQVIPSTQQQQETRPYEAPPWRSPQPKRKGVSKKNLSKKEQTNSTPKLNPTASNPSSVPTVQTEISEGVSNPPSSVPETIKLKDDNSSKPNNIPIGASSEPIRIPNTVIIESKTAKENLQIVRSLENIQESNETILSVGENMVTHQEANFPISNTSAEIPPPMKITSSSNLPNQAPIPTTRPASKPPIRPTNLKLFHSENEEMTSPEFTNEPITSRIQKFEKQASFEAPEKKERQVTTAKPVGPWVKKTSTGPVSHDAWGHTWQDLPTIDQQPSYSVEHSHKYKMSNPPPAGPQQTPIIAPEPPTQNLSHNALKRGSDDPAVNKNLLSVFRNQPRRMSSGDFSHNYIDIEVPDSLLSQKSTAKSGIKSESAKATDLFDPWCDPANPKVIQFQDISAASFKIKSGIMNTPCTRSNISSLVNMDIFFKKEFNQFTGSFKERGARYTLLCLSEEQKSVGVIAASAGNHALALSYHGQELGIPITVVMPVIAPIMKVQACRQFDANVLVKGKDIGESKEIALRMAKEKKLMYINGYDHPHILAGQGTMGLEIVEQVPNIDAVVVPVGGGGLIAGVALAVKSLYPHIKVIGVESERCASFGAAMKAKKPVYVEAEPSLADGLAVPVVGVNAFATACRLIDKIVAVQEEWIAIAILRLVEIEKAVVEGAGAAALAALLAGQLPELIGKRVIIPLCGGNIDTTVLGRCLERGLAADGRLVKFTVTVTDRPGGIADLTRQIANLGVSIKDMLHERAWIRSDIFSVEVNCLCETKDYEHFLQLKSSLESNYKIVKFSLPNS